MPVQDDREIYKCSSKSAPSFHRKSARGLIFQRVAGSKVVEEIDMTEVTKRKKPLPLS